jgi:hypothetical protein
MPIIAIPKVIRALLFLSSPPEGERELASASEASSVGGRLPLLPPTETL